MCGYREGDIVRPVMGAIYIIVAYSLLLSFLWERASDSDDAHEHSNMPVKM